MHKIIVGLHHQINLEVGNCYKYQLSLVDLIVIKSHLNFIKEQQIQLLLFLLNFLFLMQYNYNIHHLNLKYYFYYFL